jgi:hypothetical protein
MVTAVPQLADLSSRALFSDVDVKLWLAKVTDKKVGDEVADRHKITRKAGRYEKNLFPFEPQQRLEYDALATSLYSVYKYWQSHTVPWQFGIRLLKASFFGEFSQFMKLKSEEVEVLKRKFKKVYPKYIDLAEETLKNKDARAKLGIFRRADYPEWKGDLENRFGFSVHYDPVVAPGDFRLELDAALLNELKQNHAIEYESKQTEMTRKFWKEVHGVVMRAAKLSDSNSKVYDTIFLTELANTFPMLNLYDDPEMSAIGTELKNNLADQDVHIIRTDGGARNEVAVKAQRLADRMAKYMMPNP